jgi:hypothetical protein
MFSRDYSLSHFCALKNLIYDELNVRLMIDKQNKHMKHEIIYFEINYS